MSRGLSDATGRKGLSSCGALVQSAVTHQQLIRHGMFLHACCRRTAFKKL